MREDSATNERPAEWDEEIDGPIPETPKVNRFYPRPRGVRAIFRDGLRWARLVPNRADRRSAMKRSKNV